MHLSDAIMAAHIAQNSPQIPDEMRAMLSRTAIASSVFALECAANDFIDRLPKDGHFRSKAELWPALDKFDLFLLSRPSQPKLPRGEEWVRTIAHIIKLRDHHVHPRSVKCKLQQPQSGQAAFAIEWPSNQIGPVHPISFGWTAKEAKSVIAALLNFLKHYFQLATLSPRDISNTLLSVLLCSDEDRAMDFGNFADLIRLAKELDLDISCLFPPGEKLVRFAG